MEIEFSYARLRFKQFNASVTVHQNFFDRQVSCQQCPISAFLQIQRDTYFFLDAIGLKLFCRFLAFQITNNYAMIVQDIFRKFGVAGRNAVAVMYNAVVVHPPVNPGVASAGCQRSQQQQRECQS